MVDIFGLKLWDVIQGLRTLRDTGLTREMEVWGVVDGHLVSGIIDSLSYSCPNAEFEEEILSSQGSRGVNMVGCNETGMIIMCIFVDGIWSEGVETRST